MLVRTAMATALAVALVVALAPDAAAEPAYRPPVPGEVVDDWRPPATARGRGNRGIDLAARPGDDVRAAAAGTVAYAGRIGRLWHVVVLHADGLRTSYSFLAGTTVRRGDAVGRGDRVGIAAGVVHFGVRRGDVYLDPLLVLDDDGPPKVHLVPTREKAVDAEAEERRGLLQQLGAVAAGGGRAVGGAMTAVGGLAVEFGWDRVEDALRRFEARLRVYENGVRAIAHLVWEVETGDERRAVRAERFIDDQARCTPSSVPTPRRPGAGRVALLVGGLGSATGDAAVLDVDTEALGYDAVVQFSYAGGEAPYDAGDTHGDIEVYGDRLRARLVELARERPGVPVDVVAHSMGGLVVRAGLSGADAFAPDMPVIPNVVTMASPHHGTTWATVAAGVQLHPRGRGVLTLLDELTFGRLPAVQRSTGQMSAGSSFVQGLADDGLPAGTNVTSIAATGDWVVSEGGSAIDDATNVLVPVELGLGRLNPHDALPGDPQTQRELALAVAGMGPQCRDVAADLGLAGAIATVNRQAWAEEAIRADLDGLPGPEDLGVHSPAAPGGNGSPG